MHTHKQQQNKAHNSVKYTWFLRRWLAACIVAVCSTCLRQTANVRGKSNDSLERVVCSLLSQGKMSRGEKFPTPRNCLRTGHQCGENSHAQSNIFQYVLPPALCMVFACSSANITLYEQCRVRDCKFQQHRVMLPSEDQVTDVRRFA